MATEFAITATLVEPAEPATMTLDQLVEELRDLERWRAGLEQERRDLDSDLRRRQHEHSERLRVAREFWGRDTLPMPSELEDAQPARERLAELDATIEEINGRRDALLVALGERIAEEEATVAAARAACEAQERGLAARREQLRELAAELAAFEGIDVGRLLATRGLTWRIGEELAARRRELAGREARLRRARSALAATPA